MDNDTASESSNLSKRANSDQPSLNNKQQWRETVTGGRNQPIDPAGHGTNASANSLQALPADRNEHRLLSRYLDDAEALISVLHEPVLLLDRELRVQCANKAFYKKFHLSKDETQNQFFFRLANEGWNSPDLKSKLKETLDCSEPVEGLEVRYTSPTLGAKTLNLNLRPFPGVAHQSDLILIAIQDITPSPAETLLGSSDEVSRQQPCKEEFLAMLSHELRNPLAPIASALELLGLQQNESKTQQHARTIIERQVKQLKRVIDDLHEVSRMTRGKFQLTKVRTSLNAAIDNAVETVRPLLDQFGHQFQLSVPPQSIWVEADPDRLEQVIVNLLSNAAKYTNPGGQIWLTVTTADANCEFHVKDTGVGIAPEFLPQIFDFFTQADRSLDRSKGGLGIGLSLVKRLVELHGGRIEVTSRPGEGSDFGVSLPLSGLPQQRISSVGKETKQQVPSDLRVMIVDDNEDGAQTLGMLLLQLGYEALTVHDGPTSIEAALDYRPHVILLDIGLPGLNGYEVARKLRERPEFKDVLIVAMTGYGDDSDRQSSVEAGINHHLIKPSDFEKLQQLLEEFVKQLN